MNDFLLTKIIFGDCRDTMRQLAADRVKVQTGGTSPPYFGLREYGHQGQIGLDATPEQYIEAMVEVFRCVKDILADDGTLWVNLGDSYGAAGGNTYAGFNERYSGTGGSGGKQDMTLSGVVDRKINSGMRPKNLLGIPWRVALALQSDGWYLRQDIIWHKPNPMPESVQDRCTKAHEYIFLLSKSQKYFYDNEAIKEPAHTTDESNRDRDASRLNNTPGRTRMAGLKTNHYEMKNKRSVWTVNTKAYSGAHFENITTGWKSNCNCGIDPVQDVVLDPFMGSGTTAQVAQQLGRKYLGCELNHNYKALQDQRIAQTSLELI